MAGREEGCAKRPLTRLWAVIVERPDPLSIPESPGVYLYKDARGRILYVGKARILRRRVLSYFRSEGLVPKTKAMLAHAVSLEFLTTSTEKEALLLESSLIKKHRPHYNIVLRDDKQYFLFRLDTRREFPRLEIVRHARRDGARYFGPFTSATAARDTWKILHRAFSLRRCSDRAMKNRIRPCLYHHMGQCPAPCMGEVSPHDYHRAVRQVCALLDGHAERLLKELENEMLRAADSLEFELAARLRDQKSAVERTVERQAAILPGKTDTDVLGIFEAERGLALGLIFVRNGSVIDGRAFYWPGLCLEDAPELLVSFLSQYYGQALPPARILLPWLTPEMGAPSSDGVRQSTDPVNSMTPTADHREDGTALLAVLADRRGGPVRLIVPKNRADNQLVEFARVNAREEARRHENRKEQPILDRLANALHLPMPPQRIECVDVSHTSGKQTRVGMSVYVNGTPSRKDYRIYAMPDSADDCATLHAWIPRRLESGPPWPDLLLIDGGRGQLAAVERAFEDAGKKVFFALAAIAKARDERGHADRRAGNVADKIFIPGRSNPLPLHEGSPEMLFLQQVRDTTHRFAITRHRRARQGAAMTGELMRLPGIGPATARLLWDTFGSVPAMRDASIDVLCELPGIGRTKARNIKEKLERLG